jgi:hypothetical protein
MWLIYMGLHKYGGNLNEEPTGKLIYQDELEVREL